MSEESYTPKVGKNLLRSLIQLYNNPRCIYREYIQNGLDSINEAVRTGVLRQNKDGLVMITLGDDDITIEDNGTGIKATEAPQILLDIANSRKNGINTAGRFGVGRLAGGGYSEQLTFTTSYQGEAIGTMVSMDIKKLRDILNRDDCNISAAQGMKEICEVSTFDDKPENHFFKVQMHHITSAADVLLNEADILSYIRQTAPIGYSTVFNTLINSSKQTAYIERHKQIDKIKVSLNGHADIEKSYGRTIKGNGDTIEKIRYFSLPPHPKYGELAWGWYAVTRFSKQIPDNDDENVGLRLRIHNISLDKELLNPLFKEPRGNKYFYGEIFITCKEIETDIARQGLAASGATDALKKQLTNYFKSLYQVYAKANKYKKSLEKIIASIEEEDEATNPTDKIIGAKALKANIDKFQKDLAKNSLDEVNDVIDIYKKEYNKECRQKAKDILANGSTTSSTDTLPSDEQHGQDTAQEPSPSITGGEPAQGKKPATKRPKTQRKVQKPLEELVNSGKYTEEQVTLLRQVYKLMDINCPDKDKKKLEKLLHKAVNNLINGIII